MKLEKLRVYFEAGDLISALVTPAFSDGKGWLLQVKRQNGVVLTMQLDKKKSLGATGFREQERVFKSIDAAVKSAESIGFKEVKVNTVFKH
ncbi:hypothetical protein AAEU29_20495 [Pseudoalteromonas sp. SSM20]|uniref:hypothetical protein n=1 Tax=Pseudoalteromonas sp. SSM20 TaxID=3139394 RepID=UPI003BAC5273